MPLSMEDAVRKAAGEAADRKIREQSQEESQRLPPAPPVDSQLEKLLADRGNKYGSFTGHAILTQALKQTFYLHMHHHNPDKFQKLTPSQREAIDMIFHKLGRIGNGDPNYADSWVDIAGYAQLVVEELNF